MTEPSRPMISVITVCFNATRFLPRAMESLRVQQGASWEWVVVDGGSSDGTQAMLHATSLRPTTYVSEPDQGIYDAMNKAVRLARGEVLFFLNADDRLHDPRVLAEVAAAFQADPSLSFLLANVIVEKPGSSLLHTQRYITALTLPYTDPCHQGLFVRRELFDQVGLFDLAWPTSADYDWFLRVRRSGCPIRHMDRTVACFRAGGAHASDPAALMAERRAIRQRHVTGSQLAVGAFAFRVLRAASRALRGGMALGESRIETR